MAAPASSPTQPDPAEGPRADEPAADTGGGQGRSADEPAEGRDDAPDAGAGSPDAG